MLKIVVPGREFFNEETSEFEYTEDVTLLLEHSLDSMSEWESKWCKPFLSDKEDKTDEEMVDYIRCMTLNREELDPTVYYRLSQENLEAIRDYIQAPHTATWFPHDKRQGNRNGEVVTAELVYYWMIALTIPPEYSKWHLNKLMTLIRLCNIKNDPKKNKMGKNDVLKQNAALNAARRKPKK